MRVSAVIPNWNGLHYLRPLFADLAAQTRPPDEIVVVDNGSADGSAEWAEDQGARVVRFPSNRGFAAAVNAGADNASGEVIAVLNNDVRLDPAWLQRLLDALRGPAALACSKVLSANEKDQIDGTFDAVCLGGTAWRCGSGLADGPLWSRPRVIQFAPMTAMVVRAEVFREAGGLDEAFESYLEDVDFGLRCAALGHPGVYVPDAVARHVGSGTLGRWNPRTVRQISRNQVFLLARHYPEGLLWRYGWRILWAHALWGAVAAKNGCGWVWLKGKVEGLRRWKAIRRPGWPEVELVLGESERLIRQLQREAGADWYWRMYFTLTGGAARV